MGCVRLCELPGSHVDVHILFFIICFVCSLNLCRVDAFCFGGSEASARAS